MNLSRKTTLSAAVAGAMLLGGAGAALAGTTEENYSTTVPRWSVGYAYTASQTKATTGAAGKLWVESIGGDYGLDARMNNNANDKPGTWARMGDRTYADLFNSISGGGSARVQFSSDASTPVNTQVSGVWRSM